MLLSSHSVDEWLQRRPLIEHLYLEKNLTMAEVCHHLCGIGFHVNTRMVKTRIQNWGLHKHCHLPELRTALKLLGPDKSQWLSQTPKFLINRRVVDLDYILRSCGRKGIQYPFEWICTTSDEDYKHSSNVELLTDTTPADCEAELDYAGQHFSHSTSTMTQLSTPSSFSSLLPKNPIETVLHHSPELPSRVNWPLSDPTIYIHTATAIQLVQSYCLEYMASTSSLVHHEPKVHHFTCHARFLDQMDEGIYLFGQQEFELAINKFNNGIGLLKDMFIDLHPMAIATYLLLLCKLSVANVTPVLVELPKYAQALAGTLKPAPNHLVKLLSSISKSRELLELPLRCLRAASDVLEVNATMHWKTLYVKERHCDALYHAQAYGELATRRAQLLKLQEARYGPSARNVLWTSLNVADDYMSHNRLNEAEARFAQVMQQADQHSGYHRAKTRVVALEGLAKVAHFRALEQLTAPPNSAVALRSLEPASELLSRALAYANEALEMAQVWFENASRRIKRLLDLRDRVQSTLDSLLLSARI